MPLKVREIIKLIEHEGWCLHTARGSHRQFKHPTAAAKSQSPVSPATHCTRILSGAS